MIPPQVQWHVPPQVQEKVPNQVPNDPLIGNAILEEFRASMTLLSKSLMAQDNRPLRVGPIQWETFKLAFLDRLFLRELRES